MEFNLRALLLFFLTTQTCSPFIGRFFFKKNMPFKIAMSGRAGVGWAGVFLGLPFG